MSASAASTPAPPPAPAGEQGAALLQHALALATLAPALVLALPPPLGPLHADPAPELAATGWWLLLSIPAAALALLARPVRGLRAAAPLCVPAAVGLAWILSGAPADTLERDRWLLGALAAAIALSAGARLDARGKRTLAAGACALTLLLAVGGLLDPTRAGAPQNAGELAEAALPGAAIGAVLALGARGAPRLGLVGALAALLAFVHALAAPVVGFSLALAAGLAGAAAASFPRQRSRAALLVVVAAGVLLAPVLALRLAARSAAPGGSPGAGRAATSAPAELGGVPVRLLVWRASASAIAASPLAGFGPGQFAREFPRYRDPEEIERSSFGRTLGAQTEVEHAHSEPVAIASELGLASLAAALLVALASLARGVLRLPREAPREELAVELALGAGLCALLAQAAWNTPFSDDPLAACAGWALLGTRLPLAARGKGRGALLVAIALVAPAFALAPRALSLVRHGRALVALTRADAPSGRTEQELVERALRARGDSVLARTLAARLAERRGLVERALEEWERVLALRPWRVEALVQSGTVLARAGRLAEAVERYRAALALDPAHPAALWNAARVELLLGDLARGLSALDALERREPLSHARLESLGVDLVLAGLDREGGVVLARARVLERDATPELLYARAREARAAREERLADAYEALAHRAWAREHARAGRWHDAVRSYRQVLRVSGSGGRAATRVELELAAAALGEGDEQEARERLAGLEPSPADWDALPGWASEQLVRHGLGAPTAAR